MAFKGTDPVRSKILMNSNIIEKTNTSNYQGWSISYQNEKKDITVRVSKFLNITGIINRISNPSQIQKHTTLKTQGTLALPTLLYRWET